MPLPPLFVMDYPIFIAPIVPDPDRGDLLRMIDNLSSWGPNREILPPLFVMDHPIFIAPIVPNLDRVNHLSLR